MKPEIWGPHFWYMLHTISFAYPIQPTEFHKTAYREFYMTIKDVLPCETCRRHYKTYIITYPITPYLDSRAELIKWVIQIHNFVNHRLGKRIFTIGEVLNIYRNLTPHPPFSPKDTDPYEAPVYKSNWKLYLIILLIFIMICWSKYYCYRYHYV
jgi:hypothetical protein